MKTFRIVKYVRTFLYRNILTNPIPIGIIIIVTVFFSVAALGTNNNATIDDNKTLFIARTAYQVKPNTENLSRYLAVIGEQIAHSQKIQDSLESIFYRQLAQEVGQHYAVSWKILYGHWMRESKMDPSVKGDGKTGRNGKIIPGSYKAFGMGQVHLRTARQHFRENITSEELMNPVVNGYATGAIFRDYLNIMKGDYVYAISAYQQGPIPAKHQQALKQAPKNWAYVKDVLSYAMSLE